VLFIALQPDGKLVLGGNFTLIGDTNGNTFYFTRLNADGSTDATFHPPAGLFGAPAIQPDGKIIISVTLDSRSTQLVRLNPDGTRDNSWSVFLRNGSASVSAFLPDGRMLITGSFHLGDGRVARIARLNPDGSFDATFDPGTGPDDRVRTLVMQPDGKILIGGDFFNYNGATRDCIARLKADGSLDTSFLPVNPNSSHAFQSSQNIPQKVGALALQPDGKIFVGSYYGSNVALSTPNRIFRLSSDGQLDASFPLGSGLEGIRDNVDAMVIQPDGQLLIGGEFNVVNGGAHLALARLIVTPPTVLPPGPATLANISTRMLVEDGDNVLIGGFIVTGTQPKKLIVRGIGPSLSVDGKLADPTLELHDSSGGVIESNDNWGDAANRQEIIDSKIPPTSALESAILRTVVPGAYTAILRGANNTTGVGVVEIYDLDVTVDSKLANISSRGLVQTGDNVMIAGFIVTGSAPQKVIVRAIGPSLTVPGKLEDPNLELRDQNGGLIDSNDNWIDSADKQAIIDSTVAPTDNLESAIIATLPSSGAQYTAIVRGVNTTTGVAVVDVFALN
jgi:uncharacterized delta-60 repeat protein